MIITTYICDRCHHQQDYSKQMWRLNLQIKHADDSPPSSWETTGTQLWCRKCVDEMQLKGFPRPIKEDIVEPEVSFESKLREIIQKEVNSVFNANVVRD